MKQKLHTSHLGAESCLQRARETIFCQVKELILSCETCHKYETSNQKECLMPHEVPSQPWEQIEVNLFELNKKEFMVTVDYFSNIWEVDHLTVPVPIIKQARKVSERKTSPQLRDQKRRLPR